MVVAAIAFFSVAVKLRKSLGGEVGSVSHAPLFKDLRVERVGYQRWSWQSRTQRKEAE
jgi:hypothetical protein